MKQILKDLQLFIELAFLGFFYVLTWNSCENAVNFLCAWKVDLNKQDFEGHATPLHLAVLSGNTKIVRRLLLSGA